MGIETDPLSYLTRRILILRSAKPVCPNFEAPGHPPPPDLSRRCFESSGECAGASASLQPRGGGDREIRQDGVSCDHLDDHCPLESKIWLLRGIPPGTGSRVSSIGRRIPISPLFYVQVGLDVMRILSPCANGRSSAGLIAPPPALDIFISHRWDCRTGVARVLPSDATDGLRICGRNSKLRRWNLKSTNLIVSSLLRLWISAAAMSVHSQAEQWP